MRTSEHKVGIPKVWTKNNRTLQKEREANPTYQGVFSLATTRAEHTLFERDPEKWNAVAFSLIEKHEESAPELFEGMSFDVSGSERWSYQVLAFMHTMLLTRTFKTTYLSEEAVYEVTPDGKEKTEKEYAKNLTPYGEIIADMSRTIDRELGKK